jgi:hypothetical protein
VPRRTFNIMAALIPVLILFGLTPPLAVAGALIRNIPPTAHLAPVGTSLATLADAIRLAANEEGWVIVEEAPGLTQASLHIRTHSASVGIGFDELNYWIEYLDSVNLDYNPDDRIIRNNDGSRRARIHINYLRWLDGLAKQISIRTRLIPKLKPTDLAPSKNPLLIADELEKLDALRERGVLSQEEFDSQKVKLLGQ